MSPQGRPEGEYRSAKHDGDRMTAAPALSIVIPAYNEVGSLATLVERTIATLTEMRCEDWEILVVDDGSTDGTTEVARRLATATAGVKAIVLRTNFGKSAALMAGFHEARGAIVITMDADLQDDPTEIPRFVAAIEGGFDLVSGWKKNRRDPLEKRLPSRVFNHVLRRTTGLALHDINCGFKAYRRWCAKALEIRGNQHRFIPAILSWRGAKVGEIDVLHHPRQFGASKYGVSRYLHGAIDLATLVLLTKFSQKPLYLFALMGIPLLVLGGAIGGYLVVNHFLFLIFGTIGEELHTSRPLLLIAAVLVLAGLQIFLIGLLAELVLRSSTFEKGYSVAEIVSARDADVPRAARRDDAA
jgi:glycosyltransferase involved in cell wall biosynthesis